MVYGINKYRESVIAYTWEYSDLTLYISNGIMYIVDEGVIAMYRDCMMNIAFAAMKYHLRHTLEYSVFEYWHNVLALNFY